jgi:carbon-monoxide dehydrogenase large subunit
MPKPIRLDGTAVNATSAKSVAAAAPSATLGGGQNMTETRGCACEIGIGPIFQAHPFVESAFAPLAHSSVNGAQFPMNIQNTARTGIGERVLRTEDPKLLRGQGRYTDDINLPRQAYAFIVRSTVAHGRIKSIGTAAAKGMPGVLGVYTGEDMKPYGTLQSALPFKSKDGSDLKKPGRAALPTDKVRFAGDPIACVVAETLLQAKDAAEAIEIDIEPLPVVTTPQQAAAAGAPTLFEEVPGNVCLDFHYGDTEKVNAAFAAAAHKVKLKLINNRVIVNTIEPRAAIGEFDAAKERFTLHSCSQGVMGLRAGLVGVMKTTPDKVHVLTGNVGGSFGMKAQVYPEYVCILHAARQLGRPVKWTD